MRLFSAAFNLACVPLDIFADAVDLQMGLDGPKSKTRQRIETIEENLGLG